ncbi:MAG: Glyoxalase/bleomycin resistance protein/dioxygenase [Actinomycetia bacterium]|nr:Glyoxalase/bleomycin resistance protein/dioxygenase [Actinomycetes bacterium]
MLLDPRDQFHVGIVVDDFEAARTFLTETSGYEWGSDVQLEYTTLVPGGSVTYQQRLQYSISEPRLELVQAVAGTPLQPSSSGLHHLGYWCGDVAGATVELATRGWAWECGGNLPDGSPGWAYCFNPAGMRIELVATAMQPAMEGLWCR